MDLSKLSTEDLLALRSGDLSKVSTDGLMALRGTQPVPEKVETKAEPSTAEKIAADPFVRLGVGAIEPAQGLLQRLSERGVKSPVPLLQGLGLIARQARPPVDEAISEVKQMARNAGFEGADYMGMLGNMLSPASLLAGKAQIPASWIGKSALGAGVGAAGGTLAPAASDEESRRNTAIGATIGGALPPFIQGGAKAIEGVANTGRNIADLVTKRGPENIVNRYIRGDKVVGEKQLPSLLAKMRGADEMIPGGKPTTAEAVVGAPEGSPIAALQTIASKTGGGNSARFGQRLAEQDEAIKAAVEARRAESMVNYAKAFDPKRNPVKPDEALKALSENPYYQDAVPEAMKLAQAKGINPETNLTEFLHDIKLGLDRKLMSQGESALSAAQYREIQSLKSKLVDWLRDHNKDYEVGRKAHAAASRFIEGYKLRQELALKPPQLTNLGGGLNVAEETRPHMPNLLSRPAMIANWAMRKSGSGIEPRIDKLLADMMLDPTEFVSKMEKLPPQTRIDIERWLRSANALSAGTAAAQ